MLRYPIGAHVIGEEVFEFECSTGCAYIFGQPERDHA